MSSDEENNNVVFFKHDTVLKKSKVLMLEQVPTINMQSTKKSVKTPQQINPHKMHLFFKDR